MSVQMIKLWRDNRIDGEWEISLDDLAAQFAGSRWAGYEWPLERSVRAPLKVPGRPTLLI